MCIGIGMGGAVIWENPHHADYSPTATAGTTEEIAQ
jgi:acetyl-CoA acyltransferase